MLTEWNNSSCVLTQTLPDLREILTTYDANGNVATTYAYNPDRQLTQVQRPDGQLLTLGYDSGGRLSTLIEPRGQTTFTYHPITGQLATVAIPGGTTLSNTFDGGLLTGTTWTGPVACSGHRTYDSDFCKA